MWPAAHLAAAYLAWSVLSRVRYRRPPNTPEVWIVAFASQFPDLVDKPLAWWVPVLPAGRSLAHSLITATVLISALAVVARRINRLPYAIAFGTGYVTHVLTDAINPLSERRYAYVNYLGWPLLPLPPYDTNRALFGDFGSVDVADLFGFEGAILVAMVLLWLADGTPGIPRRSLQR
ncbi:metal-dependent hydrolase [Halorubellus salinus]|uniref:metal-dependent hydrolase n=1 Tax=Halorubellus salinus TaxID=755309 RepID=UPI001D085E13|nr:metal-dependent hydrolase [Halorubellus salinus]